MANIVEALQTRLAIPGGPDVGPLSTSWPLYLIMRLRTMNHPIPDAAWDLIHTRGLRQQKGQTIFPFFDAILHFSLYQCLVRHDHIFALHGLTDTKINIDYEMPISRLYVLGLTEGLLSERGTSDRGMLRPDLTFDFKTALFILNLSMALGLDIQHPIVYVLTKELLRLVNASTAARPMRRAILFNHLIEDSRYNSVFRKMLRSKRPVPMEKRV